MLSHDLTVEGANHYACRVCTQVWTAQPSSNCPGLKVYPKDDYKPLMTKKDLNLNGYQTLEKFLPAPAGCLRARASDDFIMLYDPALAIKRMTKSRPMTAHDLVKRGPGAYECRTCFKSWNQRPQTACPGIRVYERHNRAPLMTKEELHFMGYYATPKKLPPEAGCFYKASALRYVPLYDPMQAIPRTQIRGLPDLITEILWPVNCLSLLERLADMEILRAFSDEERVQAQELFNEVANIAALTRVYPRAELEQLQGGVIVFKVPPVTLHRFYPMTPGIVSEQRRLQLNLIVAYRKYLAEREQVS